MCGFNVATRVLVFQNGLLNLTGRVTVDSDGQKVTVDFPRGSSFTISASSLTKVQTAESCLLACSNHDARIDNL